ncbi:hypothetical protein BDV59DRAFT_202769 [Aspergillus ambiguus]|uniref:uncharacterized protein n=1 Tax=Aspergillus ambiguus TaxID=176160 RepID=UPI003CCCC340
MRSLLAGNRHSRRWICLASPFLSVLLVACYLFWPRTLALYEDGRSKAPLNSTHSSPEETKCLLYPGLNDVHVVLKTGVTEAVEKLLVHLDTTLRCVPHFTIFSDYEEDIAGLHIHDVLKGVDQNILNTHPDFELYTRVRDSGRRALSTWSIPNDPSTPSGKPNNPGWILDKWKFLPMMHETLKVRDDARWYVFMEADTYISWPNLLAWLARLNASEPQYLGNQMMIGDVIFAHGGSGFVLSNPALKQVAGHHSTRVKEWDELTDHHWAGDCVLGKALQDVGIDLLWSWPMVQGSTPWAVDYLTSPLGVSPWCYPAVTYHHMSPEAIWEIWAFEQNWYRVNGDSVALHSDVFQALIQPRFDESEHDWDNESLDIVEGVGSAADCEAQCAMDAECLQFSYEPGMCRTSTTTRRGSRKPGVVSGWMTERISQVVVQLGTCKKAEWVHA